MGWKDNLLPASFRGVAFFYEDTSREGGRRLANHEFPLRDENYLEDLGLRAKVHRIRGYVLGDDYFSDRDALE
jgi:prophage DNA circulation protein